VKRFWAIFKKEFRQIRRDPLSLGMLILVPSMLLMLYGYALSFDVKHIRVAVLDEDRTSQSRELLDSLFRNQYFNRAMNLSRRTDADELLLHATVRAVLVIPKGYAKALSRGERISLQVLVDGADANTATAAIGYFDALADRATRKARFDLLSRVGASIPVVAPEPRLWFNPELDSAKFLVPGLIGLLLMLSAVIATSLSIVREKERETIEQMMVSPIRPEELILGKTLPYVLVGLLTMTLILLLGYFLFDVVIQGSFLLLGITTLFFLFAALGMGVLISSVTRSQQMAFQIAILTTLLPSLILSGFIFPIKNMPLIIQGLTLIVIPRYFVTALREVLLKDASLQIIAPQLAAMLALGLFYNLLAAHNTRKSI
jgi:ABC-2 type transport system permease protein